MKKITLARSLQDLQKLASSRAEKVCSQDKSYNKRVQDILKNHIVNDFVEEVLAHKNAGLVRPIVLDYAQKHSDLPIPFKINGIMATKIRVTKIEMPYSLVEVPSGNDDWQAIFGIDLLYAYEALDEAGCLDNLE